MLIAPVLLIVTSPVPLCVMPVMVSGAAVFVNCTTPTPVFVALKLAAVLALFKIVPKAELVVTKAAPTILFVVLEVTSETVPAVPVKLTEPVVLRLPLFKVT